MELRPHHLLCIQKYTGHGYDKCFKDHMDQVTETLYENPEIRIIIVNGPDELCAYCPNLNNGICRSENQVNMMDRKVLSMISEVKSRTWHDLARSGKAILADKALFNEICGECEWKKLCDKTI